jgi:phosphopantetheinyl transferase
MGSHLIPRANGSNLQFSVSHSSYCCMLAVRLDRSIGIDAEKVRDLPQALAIAQSYFTPAESRVLAALQRHALICLVDPSCIICLVDP